MLGCGRCWKVGWQVGRLVAVGFLAEVGGRRRRECGKVERLFLGSSSVERAHNLSNGVVLGSGEAEEPSGVWISEGGVGTLTKWNRDSLVTGGEGERGVFAQGDGVIKSECVC